MTKFDTTNSFGFRTRPTFYDIIYPEPKSCPSLYSYVSVHNQYLIKFDVKLRIEFLICLITFSSATLSKEFEKFIWSKKKIIFIKKKCTNHWMQIRLMKNTQIPLWARIHFAESNVFVRIRTSLVRLNSPNRVQRRFQISFQRRFVAIITQTLTRVTHLQKDNSREFVMKLPTKGTDKPLLPNRLLYKINLGSSLFYSKQKSLVEIDPAKMRSTRKE